MMGAKRTVLPKSCPQLRRVEPNLILGPVDEQRQRVAVVNTNDVADEFAAVLGTDRGENQD